MDESVTGGRDPAAEPEGRRERLRRETLAELKEAAFDEMRAHGAVGLSLRSVARRMAMSPAGLYRYVASREELLTMLIAEAFHELGRHLERALDIEVDEGAGDDQGNEVPSTVVVPEAELVARLRAVALAYRGWCVAHPNEFGLLFGDPIAGYEAPVGGPTVAGMRRVGAALGAPLLAARQAGLLRVPLVEDPELVAGLAPMAELAGQDDPGLALLLLTTWGRLHGQVSLEVFGHHAWLFPGGCEALYRADLEALLTDLGLTASVGGHP